MIPDAPQGRGYNEPRRLAFIPFAGYLNAVFVFCRSLLLLVICSCAASAQIAGAGLNSVILDRIREMPRGGQYSASRIATIRLQSAAHFESGRFFVLPDAASPSYCSGATYLVFLKTIEHLRREGRLDLPSSVLSDLIIRGQRDGEGVWGRWNANGPGTARLFHELGVGRNFTSYDQAQPGDFMKIFWSNEVGVRERGHSVIFLGTETLANEPYVKFWSSNQPAGYGEKSVARAKIAQVIFSRFQTPEKLAGIGDLPEVDSYLAGLLKKPSSFAEVKSRCGM